MSDVNDLAIGIDFGTTNTVLASASANRAVDVLAFPKDGETHAAYRSILCFWQDSVRGRLERRVESGAWAIDHFVADPQDCRFLQSFKSFAASASFQETAIYGKRFQFEDLLSTFLNSLASHVDGAPPTGARRLVVGRPVTFAGDNPDAALALSRYDEAFTRAGFGEVHYVYEPVAAAFFFAQRLTTDATVLVADFGGGTSDFSIIRFEVSTSGLRARPLGHAGVGVAGDTFDYRIIDRVVCPRIGKGGSYRSGSKILPVSNGHYASFSRWHSLFLMKAPSVLRELRAMAETALEPEGLLQFIEIIEEDMAYQLYQAVADAKIRLSTQESAVFRFKSGGVRIEEEITRAQFDGWIGEDIARIEGALDEALARAGTAPEAIDRVFLTGGTSYVPAVRALFEGRFGAGKIERGNEFDSIASGLALISREDRIDQWTAERPA